MTADVPTDRDQVQDYLNLLDRARAWVESKGDELPGDTAERVIRFRDGREATIRRTDVDLGVGGMRELLLVEPTERGTVFETRLVIGLHDRTLGVFCQLRVGGVDEPIGPVQYDASCPKILRDFLAYGLPWKYGQLLLPKDVLRFRGDAGGREFVDRITAKARCLPVIAIAEYQGFVLHPNVAEATASDLACLAEVAVLDDGATWGLTRDVGAEWSCYNGAIRLYWPGLDLRDDPRRHPLWTSRRLLETSPDTNSAARRLRDMLRRRIMGISAFTVREPAILTTICAEERQRALEAERTRLRDADDYVRLAESYAAEVEVLRQDLDQKKVEIESLQDQVANLEVALRWHEPQPAEEVAPETSTPPASVPDAVDRARREHSDILLFGPNVDEFVGGLAPDAGPPDKIFQYLTQLAEYGRARRSGPIGTSTLEWFKNRNVAFSSEHATVANSTTERARRTWDDGSERRYFESHLKPAEAVHPDRCVRIYFDWNDDKKLIIVPYIGRHP